MMAIDSNQSCSELTNRSKGGGTRTGNDIGEYSGEHLLPAKFVVDGMMLTIQMAG